MLKSRGSGPTDCQRVKDGAWGRVGATRCGIVLVETTRVDDCGTSLPLTFCIIPRSRAEGVSRRVSSRVRVGWREQGGSSWPDCAEPRSRADRTPGASLGRRLQKGRNPPPPLFF